MALTERQFDQQRRARASICAGGRMHAQTDFEIYYRGGKIQKMSVTAS
jgi:hypothetical protein